MPGHGSAGFAVNADGMAVAGFSGATAMRWTREGGMEPLALRAGGSSAAGCAISGDDEVADGTTRIGAGMYRGAFRTWVAKIPRSVLHGQ